MTRINATKTRHITMANNFSDMIVEYKAACARMEERIADLNAQIALSGAAEAEACALRREVLRSEIWEMLGSIREMEEYEAEI